MKTIVELIQVLQTILDAEHPDRVKLIKEFQEEVWNDESIQDKTLNEILAEFAYDLDFYEPDKEWRKEASSYYGDDKLEEVVKNTIQKLHKQSPR